MENMNWLVPFLITISYVAVAVFIGLKAGQGREMSRVEEWAVAGRGLGMFVSFFLVGAGGISAYTFLGAPGWAYDRGVPVLYVVVYLTYMAIMFWYFGPRVWEIGTRFGHVTQAEAIADRYESRILGAIVSLVSSVGVLAYAVLQAMGSGYIVHVMSGGNIPYPVSVIIILIAISIYVHQSGLRAVAMTNVMQGILMFIVAWLVGLAAAQKFTGEIWFHRVFEAVRSISPEHLTLPGKLGDWNYAFWTTSILVSVFSIWPTHWVWWLGARSKDSLRRSMALLPAYYVVILPMLAVGFIAIQQIHEIQRSDTVAIQLALQHLGPVLTGLLGAGTLAAAMSSMEPCLHVTSLSYTRDIIQAFFKISDDEVTRIARWLVILLMGFIIAPFAIAEPASLVYILLVGYGFTAQTFPAIVGMFLWPRATKDGVLWGVVSGAIVTTVCSILWPHPFGVHGGIWGLVVNTIVFFVVSLLTRPASRSTIERFFPDMAERIYA